jgi:hypothetical protein
MQVFSRGQENLACSLYSTHTPSKVSWNRTPVSTAYDSAHHQLRLHNFTL